MSTSAGSSAGPLAAVLVGAVLVASALGIVATAFAAQAPRSPTPAASEAPTRPTAFARNLERPWAIEFLPDGRLLVTERAGRMRIIEKDGRVGPALAGVPEVLARGQGGLLDIVLSPTFADDRRIWFSYAEPGAEGSGTSVARARLGERGLEEVQVVWRQTRRTQGANHWGSRLAFARDGSLFVTLGDRFGYRDEAQDLGVTIGKVVRIMPDGTVPKDNPFVGRAGARPEIWSYGHRNIQAAAVDPRDGALWTVAHGARGGDELDRPEAGKNYGWPVITYGVDYSGAKIGIGTERDGMEQPVYYWDPVIAPSGAEFYTGERYRGWKDDLFVGSLAGGLVRLRIAGGRVTEEARYLPDIGRVRDVKQGPDGLLYLAIDSSNGAIIRLDPTQ
ncbi:MAG: PQQ-dependent sugar dehydrogenase [Burkholderiaceae bacterium]